MKRWSYALRGRQMYRDLISAQTQSAGFARSSFQHRAAHQATPPAHQASRMTSHLTPASVPEFPTPSHSFPSYYPEYNPIDNYRSYVATELAKVAGVDATAIYPLLSWTAKLDHGDLTLPVPALRIKGPKPTELAEKWAKDVGFELSQVELKY